MVKYIVSEPADTTEWGQLGVGRLAFESEAEMKQALGNAAGLAPEQVHGHLWGGISTANALKMGVGSTKLDATSALVLDFAVDAVLLKDTAVTRILDGVGGIDGVERDVALGMFLGQVGTKIAGLPPAAADKLVLVEDDFLRVETYPANPADTGDRERTWLRNVTLRQLQGEDGRMAALGRLWGIMHGWMSREGRKQASFKRAVDMLEEAVEAFTGKRSLDDEEMAAGLVRLLKGATLPLELETWVDPAPTVARMAVEAELSAARYVARRGEDAAYSELYVERFATAVAPCRALRAIVGGGKRGDSLPMAAAPLANLVAEVGRRIGVLGASAPLGPAAARAIESAISGGLDHTATQLESMDTPPQQRAEHVIGMAASAKSNSDAADMALRLGAVGGGAYNTDDKHKLNDAERGLGAIPKHFHKNVVPALDSAAYRGIKAAVLRCDSQLDQLQICASGVCTDASTSKALPREWCPLLAFAAEPGTCATNAELFDVDMAAISKAAASMWPELVARASP